jgi:hypothetical protein
VKAESAGNETYRLTAPNLGEAFISISRGEDGLWTGSLRLTANDAPVATSGGFARPQDAWEAAFELYRQTVVV